MNQYFIHCYWESLWVPNKDQIELRWLQMEPNFLGRDHGTNSRLFS
jgi:hypothetical protein